MLLFDMPYKNKEAIKAWHRNYMRLKRIVTPIENVTPSTPAGVTKYESPVTPNRDLLHPVTPSLVTPDKKTRAVLPDNDRLNIPRKVLTNPVTPSKNTLQSKSNPSIENTRHIVPYRPGITYKPGTLVEMPNHVIVKIPDRDAEDQPIPDYY